MCFSTYAKGMCKGKSKIRNLYLCKNGYMTFKVGSDKLLLQLRRLLGSLNSSLSWACQVLLGRARVAGI